MNIIDSIKSDKELSLNHWRYRLLHWFYGVEVKDGSIIGGNLPHAFYSHYCPLFHFTNMLVILFVPILLYKMGKYSVVNGAKGINWAVNKIPALKVKPLTDEEVKACERQGQIDALKITFKVTIKNNIEDIYDRYGGAYYLLSKDDFVQLWNSEKAKESQLEQKKEKALVRKKKLQAQMVLWVNISQVLVKCLIYVFYGAMALLVAYGLYEFAIPVLTWTLNFAWDVIVFLFSWKILDTIIFVLKSATILAIMTGIIYFVIKSKWLVVPLEKITFVAELGMEIVGAFFTHIGNFFSGTKEFISVFYEENCPAITIKKD